MAGAPTTYAELKTAIRDALGIDDASSYAGDEDRFIDLAESRFNATLRTRQQLATSALSMDANGEASLPGDFIAMQRAIGVEGTQNIDLIECSPEWMEDEYPIAYGGIGRHVTIDGATVRVRPITGTVRMRYYQTIPALTDANTTNWLLTAHPGLYLAAALYEAALWYTDPEGQQRYAGAMADQLAQVAERDRASRVVGRRLAVKGPTP